MTRDAFSERPWSAPLAVLDVPAHGLDVTLVADESIRRRLAETNGLAGLASVVVDLHVARRGRDGLHVAGELRARATQTCIVTLEPFEAEIVEPIDVDFAPDAAPKAAEAKRRSAARGAPVEIEEEGMDDLDAPDPIVDGKVDLGALATEFLTLGIDPYPRKPGVEFEEPAGPDESGSPFSKLANLKSRLP
jgi:hypothetical protein